MKAGNSRNGAVLAERVEEARSMRTRLKGLLGRTSLPEGEALCIEPCSSIHTFFMQFPIDVAFLTSAGEVVRAIREMRPWRATRIYPAAAKVLELPAGTLAKSDTREGDRVDLC